MIPNTGPVTIDQVLAEVGRSAGSAMSLDDVALRLLTNNGAYLGTGTPMTLQDLRGGQGYAMTCYMASQGSGIVGAVQGDGSNSTPLGTIKDGVTVREISTGRSIYTSADWTIVRVNGDVNTGAADVYRRYWGVGVWNSAFTSFLGLLPNSGASGSEVSGTTFNGKGWDLAGGYLDLRPYLGSWLNFVFYDK